MALLLITLIGQHSYLLIFLVNLLELLALPISGELTMSYSGYLIYQGRMNYFLSILLAALGAIIGISLSYLIGYKFGYRLIQKYGKYIHFGPEKYQKTAKWFDQHGNKLLILSFFIPGVRHFTGYFSGISKLPFLTFAGNAYIGAFLWGSTFVTLGKILGPEWDKFHHSASKYLGIGITCLIIFILIIFLIRRYKLFIKSFIYRYISSLSRFFTSFRKMGIFICCLSAVFLLMLIFTLGLGEEYLNNEFNVLNELNEVSRYLILTLFNDDWKTVMNMLLFLQTPLFLLVISFVAFSVLFLNRRDLLLESLIFLSTIIGGVLFKEILTSIFHYLKPNLGLLSNLGFPKEQSFMSVAVYGFLVFILVRHLTKTTLQSIRIFLPFIFLLLLLLMGIANVYYSVRLPSDVLAGYTFGATWLFFNLVLLELFSLIQNKVDQYIG
ncbi:VTT domain-containing protein [Gottfriedia sp. NPDC057991]|uniref:VTT domain-containing protein n=1 Tax=Gottfriedia sp. NPDC057991 TaxID=3346298 RepID=UPI0036DA3D58